MTRKRKLETLTQHERRCKKCTADFWCHEAQAIIYLTSPVFEKDRALLSRATQREE